ncbi:RNA polymerase subunit sigma-70 [Nonomuraea sp. 3-1Str]|uniref:RNA polymerase subunit sigma-70 n=1 Tax=Nonomuraea sp. 3-1Str TaxID=2929801 RepID=UPI00285465B4|nr:RNA polymerase subunit sigma-70 [Nonomuraea sp. 3-1Str]MDR8407382.1 RNA polymerase subunit sigma-70 [Nonomuraea sp. 3-1Str]
MSATVLTGATRDEFLREADAYRGELIAHCYQLVGSVHEAEDLVQETLLRAWRGRDSFEGRSSLRTWLYRIATNVCLTALRHRSRRVLPSGLGAPADDPDTAMALAPAGTRWLQPFPDGAYGSGDPADVVAGRTVVRLALLAALQYLPARQRAVFILREVLEFSAAEIAGILRMSVPAVKSSLQRARARVEEIAPTADKLTEPDSPEARRVLDRYMAAFENADAGALSDLLRDDAFLQSAPMTTWFSGKASCVPHLIRHTLARAVPGTYRMYATVANGQPTAVAYLREDAGRPYTPFGVAVLDTDGTHITGISVFADPALVALFGFPDEPPVP